MSPPISKDWWMAAALTTVALPAAVAQTTASTAPRAGVVSAVTPTAPAVSGERTVVVGNDVVPGQRFTTGPNGPLHILFLDQSALTLGADSELVIDAFDFDPESKQGQIRLGLNKGLLRVVGGQISKTTATVIATPQGTVEILGGITMIETSGSQTSATFLFGQQMRVSDAGGNTQTVTRPGFGVALSNVGVSGPQRVSSTQLSAQLAGLAGPGAAGAGAAGAAAAGAVAGGGIGVGAAAAGVAAAPVAGVAAIAGTSGQGTTNPALIDVIDTRTNPSQTLRNILSSGHLPTQS
jgi:hypothetical protein